MFDVNHLYKRVLDNYFVYVGTPNQLKPGQISLDVWYVHLFF